MTKPKTFRVDYTAPPIRHATLPDHGTARLTRGTVLTGLSKADCDALAAEGWAGLSDPVTEPAPVKRRSKGASKKKSASSAVPPLERTTKPDRRTDSE